MFALCNLVNVYSLRSYDELVLSTPINIWRQLRTNNYQHLSTKKIGLRTYCVHVYVRSQDSHKLATSRNIVSRVSIKNNITKQSYILLIFLK
jgi:hypothetical protein